MLIRKKIIAILVSLILTASLFMTQILAAETDDVSGNDVNTVNTADDSGEEETGDPEPSEESGDDNHEEDSGNSDNADGASDEDPAMVVIDSDDADTEETVSDNRVKRKESSEEEKTQDTSEDTPDTEDPAENEDQEDRVNTEDSEENNDEVSDADEDVRTDSEDTVSEESEESEKEWLDEHGIKENEDGLLEYTDENGDTWEFAPDDPEMFKRVDDEAEYDRQTPIGLKYSSRDAALGEEQDPYSLILNPDFKFRYPKYYRKSDEETLPDVRCGMDISRYQGVISAENWKRLKDEYGIEFVFIRAGYRGYGGGGSLNEDECCTANIENAHDAGVAVGIYYFSQAISVKEAEAEADHCLEILDGYQDMITLPVVTDYEYSGSPGRLRGAALSDAEHTSIVNAFCDRVESEGYLSGIYANKSMLQRDMILEDIPDNHLIWMANFVCDDGPGTYSTTYYGPLCSWQFSSRFTGFGEAFSGLHLMKSVNLDLDLWYGDFPGEEKWVPEDVVADVPEDVSEAVSADAIKDVPEDDEGGVLIVDKDSGEKETYVAPEGVSDYPMSISKVSMTAENVEYSTRPRAYRSVIRLYDSDGSRLAAGFDYDRELQYTYDKDTVVKRRSDMWARKYEEVSVSAGEPVDMKRDVIPVGAVIRVTATGKGRYEDPDEQYNTVSATFRIVPENEKKEEPVEIEAVTEEGVSGKQKKLLSRLITYD